MVLNRFPGVRPIGIGETMCRIIKKAVCLVTHPDDALVWYSDQLCVGLQAGIEETIHSMNDLFSTHHDKETGGGVLRTH